MNRIIAAADLPQSLWLNKAGRKADIAAGEGWLLGFAWLDQDAPFSDYSGFDRTITLLEGPGFTLDLPSGSVLSVATRFEPAAFDGAGPMACRVKGPCRVLNAISAYPGMSHTVQVVPGADLASIKPGESVFAVVLRGAVGAAGPLDTVVLTEATAAPDDSLIAVIRFQRDPAP